jgi:hypothetical protein
MDLGQTFRPYILLEMSWILIFSSCKHILSKPVDFSTEIRRFLRVDPGQVWCVWEQQMGTNRALLIQIHMDQAAL